MEIPCKNCCFAIYDQSRDVKPTQIDCEMGLLDKFRIKNITITEVYDNDKNFFVINTICPYFRNNNIKLQPRWKYCDDENRREKVLSEVSLTSSLIIYLHENSTVDDLKKTLLSIYALTTLPQELIIISNRAKIRPSEIRGVLTDKIPYKIELTVEPLTRDDCWNVASVKSSHRYLSWITAGRELSDIYTKLNQRLQNLETFLVYSPKDSENGTTVNKLLFELLGRCTGKSFFEKFQNIPQWEKYIIYE